MDLHSIRFSTIFVCFFTFLLLREKVCNFSSAFLYVHICTNQAVTYWTIVFRKFFFVKEYSSILKYRFYRLYKNFWTKFFYLYITVYLMRIWTYKNADEKAHTFSRKSKNVQKQTKRTKNGCCVISPLRVEGAQISNFLVDAKILPLWKAFFNLNLPHSTLGKKDIALIFFYI